MLSPNLFSFTSFSVINIYPIHTRRRNSRDVSAVVHKGNGVPVESATEVRVEPLSTEGCCGWIGTGSERDPRHMGSILSPF